MADVLHVLITLFTRILAAPNIPDFVNSFPETINALKANVALTRYLTQDFRTATYLGQDLWKKLCNYFMDRRGVESLYETASILQHVLDNVKILEMVRTSKEYTNAVLANRLLANALADDFWTSVRLEKLELWRELLNVTRENIQGRIFDFHGKASILIAVLEKVEAIGMVKYTIEYTNAVLANRTLALHLIEDDRTSQILGEPKLWKELVTVSRGMFHGNIQQSLYEISFILKVVLENVEVLEMVKTSKEYVNTIFANRSLAIALTEDKWTPLILDDSKLWRELINVSRESLQRCYLTEERSIIMKEDSGYFTLFYTLVKSENGAKVISAVLFCIILSFSIIYYHLPSSPPAEPGYEVTLRGYGYRGNFIWHNAGNGCVNVPGNFNDRAGYAFTHGTCVRLYQNVNCRGMYIQVAPGTKCHPFLYKCYFDNIVKSVSKCEIKKWRLF